MSRRKKINDQIRVKILAAMKEKGAVTPNVRQIQKITGFHRATIKSSLDFLEKEKFILGYRPLLDPTVVDYKLIVWSFLNLDCSDKNNFNDFKKEILSTKSLLHFSDVVSDKGYNVGIAHLAKNVEDYYINIQKKYFFNNPNINKIIAQRSAYYLTDPIYKHQNEVDALIGSMEEEVGL